MRRELRFKTFEDALHELICLEKGTAKSLGHWSFYQILEHCSGAMRFSMGGTPLPRPKIQKRVLGWIFKHVTLWRGFVPAGVQNPRMNDQRVEGDVVAAAQRLRETIAAYHTYSGPMTPHPFFGALTKSEWEKIHVFHMANHLGFLEPNP